MAEDFAFVSLNVRCVRGCFSFLMSDNGVFYGFWGCEPFNFDGFVGCANFGTNLALIFQWN